MNKINMHKEICDKIHNLYVAKNNDYGDSVHDTYKKYGMTSFLVRMEDKINRINSLVNNNEQMVMDEKIEDTLMDLANYAIIALIEMDNDKCHELASNEPVTFSCNLTKDESDNFAKIIESLYE